MHMGTVNQCSTDALGPAKGAIETTTNILINSIIIFNFICVSLLFVIVPAKYTYCSFTQMNVKHYTYILHQNVAASIRHR